MRDTADILCQSRSTDDRKTPGADEIRRQLRTILASPVFQGSKRCKQFLEYVCEKSLDGNAETLKERTLAVDVFGRLPQSDFGEDTIVRVGAREVRKRLAQYYVTAEGLAAKIHIDLLPGSYAPEFHYACATAREDVSPEPAPASRVTLVGRVDEQPKTKRYPRWAYAAATVVLLSSTGAIAVAKWSHGRTDTAFQMFWDPVFRSPDPLLLAVASPIVYHPSLRATLLSEASQFQMPVPVQRAIQVPANKLDGSDMIAVRDQYVGFGDMVVATEVTSMLGRNAKGTRVRLASGIQFADLRQSQTMLIGAITNRWTMELGQAWRFQFARSPGLQTLIVDTMDSRGGQLLPVEQRRRWQIPSRQDGSANEDYTLICRIRNSVTGSMLLVAAGLKQFGTEAAGRLIADPVQLGNVLNHLPRGWEDKNIQVVLHSKVIGNTPGQPEVVAWHVW